MRTAPQALRWVGKMALATGVAGLVATAAAVGILLYLTTERNPIVPNRSDSYLLSELRRDLGFSVHRRNAPEPRLDLVASRLDFAVAPRLVLGDDPESAPQAERRMIAGAERDIQLPPNPFQPGTRPAASEDEASTTEELAEKIRKSAEDHPK